MKNIAIIPARSGSKGLKDKNIKELNGRPLIWYSIQAALSSKCFDEVMVSTDSEYYAKIAKKCGASVPFLRSHEMSTDNASSWDSVKEVLVNYYKLGKKFDNVMLLQPTSPLRDSEDIVNAFDIFEKKKANSVIGVCKTEHSPLLCNTLPEDKNMAGFISKELINEGRRQSLPTYYRINGAIYLLKINYNKMIFDLYNAHSFAYCMPQWKSVDIDTILDFLVVENILKVNVKPYA